MSLRTTLLLVVVAIVVGIVVYINPFKEEEEKRETQPWFYQVSEDDLETIEVLHEDKQVKFLKIGERMWAFEDPAGIPPRHARWGGISLLVAGPQVRRNLATTTTTIDDPAQYGLDDPTTIVNVGLAGNRTLQIRLGRMTTDGRQHYGQVIGFPQLFLVVSNWGDVIARLATEPPLPKWFVKRDPEEIVEMNIYLGAPTSEEAPLLRFRQEGDVWTVKDFTKDSEAVPVDAERWADILPLLSGPPNVSVEVVAVEDGDYTPWGINDDSSTIELRFLGRTDKGTSFLDGIPFRIGDKIPDKQGYYARPEIDIFRKPVLFLDAEWTETLLNLFDDIPYTPESES